MSIFGISRGKVKEIRRKEAKKTLKRRKTEEKLKQKIESERLKTTYYKAKAERKRAKRESGFQFPILPTKKVKIRKRKQGKKLSRKSRIRLI